MPHDPITIRRDVVEKTTFGGHDRVFQTEYEAPSTPEGAIAADEYRTQDRELAANVMKWLEREYPGHMWGVIADLRQGVVRINIPILMGVVNWWVINLRTTEVIEGLKQGAGQILERYGLKRGRFQLTPFLDAREQHSALVLPSRKVPE